jgi:hypothetical protein
LPRVGIVADNRIAVSRGLHDALGIPVVAPNAVG